MGSRDVMCRATGEEGTTDMGTTLRSKFTLLFIVCAALLAFAGTALALTTDTSGSTSPAPTIQSDKDDYAPSELVTLMGANWQPGETVHINVNDDEGQTWNRNVDVTADPNGQIQDQFQLPSSFVAVYTVTATGAQSGVATTSFTDGTVFFRGTSPQPSTWDVTYKVYGSSATPDTTCSGTGTNTTKTIGNPPIRSARASTKTSRLSSYSQAL